MCVSYKEKIIIGPIVFHLTQFSSILFFVRVSYLFISHLPFQIVPSSPLPVRSITPLFLPPSLCAPTAHTTTPSSPSTAASSTPAPAASIPANAKPSPTPSARNPSPNSNRSSPRIWRNFLGSGIGFVMKGKGKEKEKLQLAKTMVLAEDFLPRRIIANTKKSTLSPGSTTSPSTSSATSPSAPPLGCSPPEPTSPP